MQFSNSSIDAQLNLSYVTRGEERETLINEIQEAISVEHVPCFYLQQHGQILIYNNKYLGNMEGFNNLLGIWDFYRVEYTPQRVAVY